MKLRRYLGNDQLSFIQGKKSDKWSHSTMKKAIMIKSKGGLQLLDYVRTFVVPLPSNSTIKRRLTKLKVSPGMLDINLKTLKADVEGLDDHQKRFMLIYDEKAIVPGVQIDHTSQKLIGFTTLPESDEKATNAMVFMMAGVGFRFKRIVAVHFMGKKIDSKLLHEFIVQLILRIEKETKCFIDGLVFDLGPHNCSVLKCFGLDLKKGSNQSSVRHPSDENRLLFLIPDVTHSAKCLASALRRSKATIPNTYVEKFNLKSGTASIKEVDGILNKQSSWDHKPGKGLTNAVLKPDHYEAMNVRLAKELWSTDVIATIDHMYETKKESKSSPMAFLLRRFNQWVKIMSNSVFTSIEDFEKVVPILEDFTQIVDKLIFEKSRIKHQTGAVWSTHGIINLVRFYLKLGMPEVKTSRFLQDVLENVFSQTDAAALKPSALQFLYALRTVTINQGMLKKVEGSSYSFDEEETRGINFLELIDKAEEESSADDEEMMFTETFAIPEKVNIAAIFGDNSLKADAFYCESNDFLLKFVSKHDCSFCRKELIEEARMTNTLKRLREDSSSEQTVFASEVLLKLEFAFAKLGKDAGSTGHRTSFIEVATCNIPQFHCETTALKLVKEFYKFRLGRFQGRFLHNANKFASKSLHK